MIFTIVAVRFRRIFYFSYQLLLPVSTSAVLATATA